MNRNRGHYTPEQRLCLQQLNLLRELLEQRTCDK
jgi:hypothetical protein